MKKLKKNYLKLTITAEDYLGYCGDCQVRPYALVDVDAIVRCKDFGKSITEIIGETI